jgi:hypothetical protein
LYFIKVPAKPGYTRLYLGPFEIEHRSNKLMATPKVTTTPPAAQPAPIPDAITDNSESVEYRSGWNECRELTIQMRKS